jgi:hypothetical protein
LGEELGLLVGPPVAGEARCPRHGSALDGDEPSRRAEHPPDLRQAGVDVDPVVDGRQRPGNGGRAVRQRQSFGGPFEEAHGRGVGAGPPGQGAGRAQHHGRRVDPDDRRGAAGGRPAYGHARPAPDVDDVVAGMDSGQPDGQVGVPTAPDGERQGRQGPADTRETGMVGVVVRRQDHVMCGGSRGHAIDLDG